IGERFEAGDGVARSAALEGFERALEERVGLVLVLVSVHDGSRHARCRERDEHGGTKPFHVPAFAFGSPSASISLRALAHRARTSSAFAASGEKRAASHSR